jgi:hypothetical protein
MSSVAAELARALRNSQQAGDRVGFAKALIGTLDPWQEALMLSDAKRILLNIHRQGGKSTATAALALHTALFRPGTLVLILSPTLRQSSELFQKVSRFYVELGRPLPTTVDQRSQLELANGSRIISLPGSDAGKSIRGYSADVLIVDEAARCEEALFHAIRPMLAVTGGRLIMLSTPHGKKGAFYEEWELGMGWERYHVTADECPRISAEFLEEERTVLPPSVYRQEYFGEFVSGVQEFFTEEDIDKLFAEDYEPYYSQE